MILFIFLSYLIIQKFGETLRKTHDRQFFSQLDASFSALKFYFKRCHVQTRKRVMQIHGMVCFIFGAPMAR